jgi:DNA polymerase-3 subunit delta
MAGIYLIVGEEYLAEEALDRIRSDEQTDPLSEISIQPSASIAELVQSLTSPSLLGGKRLVILKEADDLKKEQAEAISDALEDPHADTILALIAGGRTKLDAFAKKNGTVVTLDAPKGRKLAGWVRQRAKAHKLQLDDRGAWTLIDAVGGDLRELDGAMEQLVVALGPGAKVSAAEVKRAFPRLADERIFALTDALGERRLPAAMTALRRLIDQGDEPLMIFGSVAAHVRRLLRARRHVDGGARAVGDALGLPEWRAERMLKQARSYRDDELIRAMGLLAVADVEMKGDYPSPEIALERAVVRIITGEAAVGSG